MQHRGNLIRWATIVPASALLLLSGCGGDDDAGVPTSATEVAISATAATTEPVVTQPTSAPTTPAPTTPATNAPTTPATAAPTTASPVEVSCLIGEWIVPDAELDAYFDVIAQNASFDSIDNDGVIRLTFTADTFEWAQDFELTMVVDGQQYVGTYGTTLAGTYADSGGVLAATGEPTTTGDSLITRDGSPVEPDSVGDLFVDIVVPRPLDSLPYSCDGPAIVLPAGPRAGAEHTLLLTPA